jgi:uncharacterized SAM-binding protein YcdF (DUF218 family)
MAYGIKHLIGALLSPVEVTLLLLALALIFHLARRRSIARSLLVCAAVFGYLSSTALVGDELLSPLEGEYPPLRQDFSLPAVGYVVVLGSGYTPHDNVPITAALDPDGLARVVEGVRLMRRLQSARLIVSGGAPPGLKPSAIGYAELARGLGVSEELLTVSRDSLDTSAEALAVAKLLGKAPFLLITSAYHMPRAMKLMRRAGASPIPAPTAQRTGIGFRWHDLLPSAGGLASTERAIHEYLGLAALAMSLQ